MSVRLGRIWCHNRQIRVGRCRSHPSDSLDRRLPVIRADDKSSFGNEFPCFAQSKLSKCMHLATNLLAASASSCPGQPRSDLLAAQSAIVSLRFFSQVSCFANRRFQTLPKTQRFCRRSNRRLPLISHISIFSGPHQFCGFCPRFAPQNLTFFFSFPVGPPPTQNSTIADSFSAKNRRISSSVQSPIALKF